MVNRAHVRAHAELQRAFSAAGSRPYYFRLLAALDELGSVSQADLGRAVGMDRSDVATSLVVLVDAGFVARVPDPLDRRRNVVEITAAGRVELDRLNAVLGEVQRDFLAPLTDEEQAVFLRLIGRLVDS